MNIKEDNNSQIIKQNHTTDRTEKQLYEHKINEFIHIFGALGIFVSNYINSKTNKYHNKLKIIEDLYNHLCENKY